MQLYFMRIEGRGASIRHPRVTQISDDMPAYEEQAILTPDMRTVIMMSNRSHTVPESWFNLVVAAAQRTSFDAPNTGSTQTIQFLADFIGPNHFNADLYAVDLRTKAVRRLTDMRGGVVPEFFWDRGYRRILFTNTGALINSSATPSKTYVARFIGVPRRIPRKTPPTLYGHRIEMSRVGGQAQAIRDPGPTDNRPVAARPPVKPAPAFPHRAKSADVPQIPSVAATYTGLWLTDLAEIQRLSSTSFTAPPLLQGVGQFGG
jgi:hypothetical protein